MGEVLVGFPVYSAHSCPGGLFTTRCVTKSNTWAAAVVDEKSRSSILHYLGKRSGGQTNTASTVLLFPTLSSFTNGFGSTHGIPACFIFITGTPQAKG